MRSLLTGIFILLLFGCQNGAPAQRNVIKVDTIRISKTPALDNPAINVLKDGLYHRGEIDLLLQHRTWKGLFTNGNRSYIADAEVKIGSSFDDLVDKPGKKTGLLVKVSNKDTCVLLMSGISLNNIGVNRLKPSYLQILPGERLDFKYNKKAYRLYATGQKKLTDAGSNDYIVTAYKLFIEATVNGHHYIQKLVDIPSYEGSFHTVIKFVGDIDNDGIPDFIIDTSNYYGSDNSTLYLSSPSKSNVLYTIVGEITATA